MSQRWDAAVDPRRDRDCLPDRGQSPRHGGCPGLDRGSCCSGGGHGSWRAPDQAGGRRWDNRTRRLGARGHVEEVGRRSVVGSDGDASNGKIEQKYEGHKKRRDVSAQRASPNVGRSWMGRAQHVYRVSSPALLSTRWIVAQLPARVKAARDITTRSAPLLFIRTARRARRGTATALSTGCGRPCGQASRLRPAIHPSAGGIEDGDTPCGGCGPG